MPKNMIMISVFVLTFIFSAAHANDSNEEQRSGNVIIPPGMELKREGDVNIVVPKGAVLRREVGRIYIEDSDAYAARGFSVTNKRLDKIEKELAEQKKEIKYLSHIVDDINKTKPAPRKKSE